MGCRGSYHGHLKFHPSPSDSLKMAKTPFLHGAYGGPCKNGVLAIFQAI